MKTPFVFMALVCTGSVFICACSKTNDGVTNPPSAPNLLTNGSFNVNGVGSLQGWTPIAVDTTYVTFSADVPPGGGSVSLKLLNSWTISGRVSELVDLPVGTHRYQLSAWAKILRLRPPMFAGGDMGILLKRAGSWSTSKWLHFSDTTWVSGILIDTLAISQGDTIAVSLRGNYDQFSYGYILFNTLYLSRID